MESLIRALLVRIKLLNPTDAIALPWVEKFRNRKDDLDINEMLEFCLEALNPDTDTDTWDFYNALHRSYYNRERFDWHWCRPEHLGLWAHGGDIRDIPPEENDDPESVMIVVPSEEYEWGWWAYLGPPPRFNRAAALQEMVIDDYKRGARKDGK